MQNILMLIDVTMSYKVFLVVKRATVYIKDTNKSKYARNSKS